VFPEMATMPIFVVMLIVCAVGACPSAIAPQL
jgi:ABC-type glucose/galactose transport system permease subunit